MHLPPSELASAAELIAAAAGSSGPAKRNGSFHSRGLRWVRSMGPGPLDTMSSSSAAADGLAAAMESVTVAFDPRAAVIRYPDPGSG